MAFISFKSCPLYPFLVMNRISGQSVIKTDKLDNQFCCPNSAVLLNAAENQSFHHLACWMIPISGYKYRVWYHYKDNFPYPLYSFRSHLLKQTGKKGTTKKIIGLYFQRSIPRSTVFHLLSRYLEVDFASTEPVMPVLLLPLYLFFLAVTIVLLLFFVCLFWVCWGFFVCILWSMPYKYQQLYSSCFGTCFFHLQVNWYGVGVGFLRFSLWLSRLPMLCASLCSLFAYKLC